MLGLALGEAARGGRDKVTITASPGLGSFGGWAEQLFAESTGKNGKGLIPINGEPLGAPSVYGNDRIFIDLTLEGEADTARESKLKALEAAGHPVVRIVQKSPRSHRAGILPLRDRDRGRRRGDRHQSVRSARCRSEQDQDARAHVGVRENRQAAGRNAGLFRQRLSSSIPTIKMPRRCAKPAPARRSKAGSRPISAVSAPAIISPRSPISNAMTRNTAPLQKMRLAVRDKRHIATCLEFGPRFLHSTGQAYKGGPDSGVFLQITSDDARGSGDPVASRELWRCESGAGARRF